MRMNGSVSLSARPGAAVACSAALALLLIAGLARPLAAQTAPAGQEPKDATQAQPATPPPAPVEGFKLGVYDGHGEFEVGYRDVNQVAGSRDAYKSMVNLGQGTQLLHAGFSLRSNYGTGRLFDRMDFSMDNWGTDPYSSLRFSMSKSDKYELTADYRGMNYYNYLANYANPLLSRGNLLGQHSLDVNYRVTDIRFKLFPTSVIRPYAGYVRASSAGPGYTTFSVTGNEFLLGTNWANVSDEVLGGVEFVFPTFTFTFEQGWRFIKNDTSVTPVIDPTGNGDRPYLGYPISMDSLNRGYHDRTTLPTSKFVLKYSPFNQLKVSGRYIYSSIDLDSAMNEVRTGSLISLENQLIYSAASDAFTGKASKPDHHGAFAVEFTPFSRLTVIDRFENQSSHLSGSALLASTFFNARALSGQPGVGDQQIADLVNTFLEYNRIRNEATAEVDMGHGFYLRGGERFSYTQAKLIDSENNGRPDQREAKANQNTGIGGVTFRPGNWLRLSLDYELNRSSAAVVRTDLFNYDQLRFTWRVSPYKGVTLGGRVGLLTNKNPQTDIDLNSHNRDYSFEASYEPSPRFSLNMDYTHTSILSDMAIIIPQTLDLGRSVYDERGSSVGGSLGIDFYKGVRADVGLRAVLNAGDLPFNYYQPFATLTIPIMRTGLAFKTYWQDFGYNEKNSDLLDHRSHLFTFSLAYSR